MASLLWTIFAIVLILWLIGALASLGGEFIHLLLIVAAIVLIYNLLARPHTTI